MSTGLVNEPVEQAPGTPAGKVMRFYTYSELCAEFPESNQPVELWDGILVDTNWRGVAVSGRALSRGF